MAEKIKSINLLPNKGGGVLEQFLNWALTIGRLLIILTETLALSVFLYRFSLDMKIVDLHDKIKHQQAIVEQFKNSELTSRDLLARLDLAKKYNTSGEQSPTILSDIIEMGRNQITFKELIVSTKSIKLDIQTSNSNSLNFFISQLKKYPKISSVKIDTVENKTTSAIIRVGITAQLKS